MNGYESTVDIYKEHDRSVDYKQLSLTELNDGGTTTKTAEGPPRAATIAGRCVLFTKLMEAKMNGVESASVPGDGTDLETEVVRDENMDVEQECAFNVINETFVYDSSGVIITHAEEAEPALYGIVNTTEEVMELRHSRGQREFHKYPVIFIGTVTGVDIKFMSSSSRDNITTFIRTQCAFAGAEEELRRTEKIENARATEIRSDDDRTAPKEQGNRDSTSHVDHSRVETGTALSNVENSTAECRNNGDLEQRGLHVDEMAEELGTSPWFLPHLFNTNHSCGCKYGSRRGTGKRKSIWL